MIPRRSTNRVQVEISIPNISAHPFANQTLGMEHFGNDLISINSAKDLGRPAGQFELQFSSRKVTQGLRWDELVPLFAAVDLKFWREDKEDEQSVMYGVIESQNQRENFSTAQHSRVYAVTGKDMGGLLSDYKLFTLLQGFGIESDMFLGISDLLRPFILDPELATAGQPASRIIKDLLDRYLESLNLRIPGPGGREAQEGGLAAADVIRYNADEFEDIDDDAVYPVPVSYLHGGSLWSLIQQYADPTFHETFVDTDPSGEFCEFVHRPHPWIQNDDIVPYNSLFSEAATSRSIRHRSRVATIAITDDDIISWSISRGTADMVNLWWLLPTQHFVPLAKDWKAMNPPLLAQGENNPSDFQRFGLRTMELRTPYFPLPDSADPDAHYDPEATAAMASHLIPIYQRWQRILKAWHQFNPLLYSGQLRVKGRASFRIGDRLVALRRDADYEFYIQGVAHNIDMKTGLFISTLKVTRGFKTTESRFERSLVEAAAAERETEDPREPVELPATGGAFA